MWSYLLVQSSFPQANISINQPANEFPVNRERNSFAGVIYDLPRASGSVILISKPTLTPALSLTRRGSALSLLPHREKA